MAVRKEPWAVACACGFEKCACGGHSRSWTATSGPSSNGCYRYLFQHPHGDDRQMWSRCRLQASMFSDSHHKVHAE